LKEGTKCRGVKSLLRRAKAGPKTLQKAIKTWVRRRGHILLEGLEMRGEDT